MKQARQPHMDGRRHRDSYDQHEGRSQKLRHMLHTHDATGRAR